MEQQFLELLKEYTKHCEETKIWRRKKENEISLHGNDIYTSKSPDFADFIQWLENKINKQKE